MRRLGFDLARVPAVDDTPRKLERQYGNAVHVRPFLGEEDDCELDLLARYLASLRDVDDVRRLEKRGWRSRVSW